MTLFDTCDSCGSLEHLNNDFLCGFCANEPNDAHAPDRPEPTDDHIYNRPGVEGGIGYALEYDGPGSLGENDWRL